ncbi:MAG: ion transporter [Bacteroidales bacterium]|nr:ion transporter [Candidatus Latescibacterota bacterium]
MNRPKSNLGIWQYFILVLSVLALALLTVQTFAHLNPETSRILEIVDLVICVVFLTDFFVQLFKSSPRSAYLKWGWLDLVSSIPMLPMFRIARVVRIARIIRVLRGARAGRHLLGVIVLHRAKSTFGAVILGSFVLLLVSVIAIVSVEPALSPRDAAWWCLFTLVTGEYGDFYPASTEGRVITALLITAGVAVFGTFTASVASFFLEEEQHEDEKRDTEMMVEIGRLRLEIQDLKCLLEGDRNNGSHPQKGD